MKVENITVQKAKDLIIQIESACKAFGLDSLNTITRNVKNFSEQNRYLDLAALGQFKVGKSSFLNSLMNQHLLPVGNIPVTSVITRVKYGPDERAVATFLNGSIKEITLSEIEQYVSESLNPENRKQVLLLDIESPSLVGIKEIRFVDTPGIGSVWRHNTETTTGWFPETGGVLFLISAERPISESELSLLKDVYRYTPQIAIVITKSDLYSKEKLLEIRAFTADVIRKNFDRDFPIFLYSTIKDASRYNEELRKLMLFPLTANRDNAFNDILKHKMNALADSCLSYLDIAYQASQKHDAEKIQLKKVILGEHLNSHFIRRELQLIIGSYKEKTRESLRTYLESFEQGIEESLNIEYDRVFPTWEGNLYKVTRKYEEWIKKSLGNRIQEIMLEEVKSYELLEAVRKHLSFYLKSFRERLNTNLDRSLGIQMKTEEWDIALREFNKPDISISRSFDFHLDMLWFLFPMFIFRNIFRRSFKKQINYEIEKNLHRLTSGLTEKVNKEMDHLMSQALAYMNGELTTVEALLSENTGESSKILERINNIKAAKQRL